MAIPAITTMNTYGQWRTIINSAVAVLNDLGEYDDIRIIGGEIDGTPIGSVTPSTGIFTNITVSSTLQLTGATLILDNNAISGDKISGGTIDNVIVELPALPVTATQAANKSYVDLGVAEAKEEALIFSIIFGG